MANEFKTISDGTFSLQETEDKNQFYFYRNDGEVLTDVGRDLLDLYQAYIMQKMMSGEITDMVMSNIYTEKSEDEKCLKVIICGSDERPVHRENSSANNETPSFWKRFFHKVFG